MSEYAPEVDSTETNAAAANPADEAATTTPDTTPVETEAAPETAQE